MIFTIGHSTRALDEFVELLRAHRVSKLGDVRTVPKSRRHPHFSREALERALPAAGIEYRHFPGLGGLRKPRRDSPNSAWRHEGFRGYADYMQTPSFDAALLDLIVWAGLGAIDLNARAGAAAGPSAAGINTAIMCAEALWWRCHRQLIADALTARGIEVEHITSTTAAARHGLTSFARTDSAGRVSYPGLTDLPIAGR